MFKTFQNFNVDYQVMQLIPNTLFILNSSFIQILKDNHGLCLIKDIPSVFLESFIRVCALSNASSFSELKSFVDKVRGNIIDYWEKID